MQNGGGAPCGLGALSRKRQLAALDAGHLKKAKRADGKKCLRVRRVRGACLLFSSCCAAGMLVQSSALEELEAMSLELSAGGFALRGKAANGYNNIT